MLVKRLIELLGTKNPALEVEIVTHEYTHPEDTCGAYFEHGIEGVAVETTKPKRDPETNYRTLIDGSTKKVVRVYSCFKANLEV